jgi:hypothetical protein
METPFKALEEKGVCEREVKGKARVSIPPARKRRLVLLE